MHHPTGQSLVAHRSIVMSPGSAMHRSRAGVAGTALRQEGRCHLRWTASLLARRAGPWGEFGDHRSSNSPHEHSTSGVAAVSDPVAVTSHELAAVSRGELVKLPGTCSYRTRARCHRRACRALRVAIWRRVLGSWWLVQPVAAGVAELARPALDEQQGPGWLLAEGAGPAFSARYSRAVARSERGTRRLRAGPAMVG